MSLEQLISLAVVQGLTEFLPVSSSGHLILIPALMEWCDQGIATDVMVHMGSLFAVIVYFRRDVWKLIVGFFEIFQGKISYYSWLSLYILFATLPAFAFGTLLKLSGLSTALRSVEVVAYGTILFGIVLYFSDRYGMHFRTINNMKFNQAIAIGFAQALALIPGISRSGITITAARFLGFERSEAARFSFLLGIPAILAACIFTFLEAWKLGIPIPKDAYWAAFLTFCTALIGITVLTAIVKHTSLLVFVVYRIALGFLILIMLYDWFPSVLPSLSHVS